MDQASSSPHKLTGAAKQVEAESHTYGNRFRNTVKVDLFASQENARCELCFYISAQDYGSVRQPDMLLHSAYSIIVSATDCWKGCTAQRMQLVSLLLHLPVFMLTGHLLWMNYFSDGE